MQNLRKSLCPPVILARRREYYSNFPTLRAEIYSKNRKRGKCAALLSSRPPFPSSAFPNSSAQRRDTLLAAAPPDGSPSLSLRVGSCTARTTDKRRLPRGSRPAPGSRRLSHIRQITLLSLPCLGVYYWLRTQDSLTPATFRLPHPRPSARRGSIPRYDAGTPLLLNNHAPTILRVEYKNDTISTNPSYISDSPTPTDTQKQFNLNQKTGARSSVQSPLQAKCRASSTQRSRSRVTFVIFPAMPRPIPSKNNSDSRARNALTVAIFYGSLSDSTAFSTATQQNGRGESAATLQIFNGSEISSEGLGDQLFATVVVVSSIKHDGFATYCKVHNSHINPAATKHASVLRVVPWRRDLRICARVGWFMAL